MLGGKKLRIIKNKLIFVNNKYVLPSKAVEYVPYNDKEFEEFAMENFIIDSNLQC